MTRRRMIITGTTTPATIAVRELEEGGGEGGGAPKIDVVHNKHSAVYLNG